MIWIPFLSRPAQPTMKPARHLLSLLATAAPFPSYRIPLDLRESGTPTPWPPLLLALPYII